MKINAIYVLPPKKSYVNTLKRAQTQQWLQIVKCSNFDDKGRYKLCILYVYFNIQPNQINNNGHIKNVIKNNRESKMK